ncbi:hypothetical protein BHE90_000176 [Fusarium euwallaceae]|uniref:Uncharacterized protein n=1 Tax=Fusarium euwallaceae TaxID=1147111 RepID=A0A430MBC3_9HYPO|nr:hypothetical protein BHE90_000176 [Fusarium euwallaceae]
MLPASLAAELDISLEEMDAFEADMYSVLPGCNQLKLATASVRSDLSVILNSATVRGPEIYGVRNRMNHLDQLIRMVEEWFGEDMAPTELGSPKDNLLQHINVCLDVVWEIYLVVQGYGFRSQLETQDLLRSQSLRLLEVFIDILEFEPVREPLLRVEDVHEGMELPFSPSSPLLPSHAGEELENEELPEAPAHMPDSDQSPPMGLFQAPEGSYNIQPSSSRQLESHDQTWTFRMV